MLICDAASMLLSDGGFDHCSHFIGFVVSFHIRGGFLAEARHCQWIGGRFGDNERGVDAKI